MAQHIKEINISAPTTLLKGFGKEVEVKANGKNKTSGVIYLPKKFIDKNFFMLLLPKDDDIVEKINQEMVI